MTHDTHETDQVVDLFSRFDPWAALDDGRRQLLAVLEACDARAGARMLAIPEFATLGESTGTLAALLLAHAAREREHAAFFASLAIPVDVEGAPGASEDAARVDLTAWPAVRSEVDAARDMMLGAAAALPSERWDQVLRPPWAGAGEDSVAGLLVVRAMSDGIFAEAIGALLAHPPDA